MRCHVDVYSKEVIPSLNNIYAKGTIKFTFPAALGDPKGQSIRLLEAMISWEMLTGNY